MWSNGMVTCPQNVKKAYSRMIILHKLYCFHVKESDMTEIYTLYIRSILEQSCQVWHHSLTVEQQTELERVQKVACRIILKETYLSYPQALQILILETLFHRRETLCLNFARKCAKHPKTKEIFPLN